MALLLAPLALAALVASARGEESSSPFSIEASGEAQELAYRRPVPAPRGWSAEGSIRAGLLGATDDAFDSYPILRTSPYVSAGLKAVREGGLESMLLATAGFASVRSAAYFGGGSLNDQRWLTGSGYADLGKAFSVSDGLKGAVFGTLDGFGFGAPLVPADGLGGASGSVGAAWLARRGRDEASLVSQLELEAGHRNMYSNFALTAVPSGRLGVELARGGDAGRWSLGAQASLSRADAAVRPYLGWSGAPGSAVIAAELRKSRNPFFPDRAGLGVEASLDASDSLSVGVDGRISRDRYALDPKPYHSAALDASVSWKWRRASGEHGWAVGGDGARGAFTPEAAAALNSRLPGPGYDGELRALLERAPTLADFVAAARIDGTDGVLAAVSALTSSAGGLNYNFDELHHPNVVGGDELYRRVRASYLQGQSDPVLVCIGAAQLGALVAEELGRRSGRPISASAVTVAVPDERGRAIDHAVTLIKTPEYGLVFVDWGNLTPTKTQDTEEALRLYQAVAGVPVVFHDITDPRRGGGHVGYLYTQEGKVFLRRWTFHGELAGHAVARIFDDVPDGASEGAQRYLERLRAAFEKL